MLEKATAAVSNVPAKMVQNPAPTSVGIVKIDDANSNSSEDNCK